MKIFGGYFEPYGEFFLRTTLTEEELKNALVRECPGEWVFSSWRIFKAMLGFAGPVFARVCGDPLKLFPVRQSRNSLRGQLRLECRKPPSGPGTVLHVVIAPPAASKWFPFVWCSFALLWGIAALRVMGWASLLSFAAIGFVFLFLKLLRSSAAEEVPQTRSDFEVFLRELERKYAAAPQG